MVPDPSFFSSNPPSPIRSIYLYSVYGKIKKGRGYRRYKLSKCRVYMHVRLLYLRNGKVRCKLVAIVSVCLKPFRFAFSLPKICAHVSFFSFL